MRGHNAPTISILAIALATSAALAAVGHAAPSVGNAEAGKKVFNRYCRVCHQIDPDAGNSLGPNLARIAGHTAPVDSNYAYSSAFRSASAQGLTWNDAALERFLKAPTRMIPGTSMPMAVANATERRDLVAYLLTLKP